MPFRHRASRRVLLTAVTLVCFSFAPSMIPSGDAGVPIGAAHAQGNIGEKEAFEAAKELGTVEAWDAFLSRFNTGFRADLARAYVRKLSEGQAGGAANAPSQMPSTPAFAAPQPLQPPPLPRGQQMSDANAPGVAFEVLFGHFRAMATQRYFAAGPHSYKICMQECAADNSCNFWVFQPADPKFVNQGSVDRCFLMSEAGRATPSPWCTGCTTGRRVTVGEPLQANPQLPTYSNVRWEKTPPRLRTGSSAAPKPSTSSTRERVKRVAPVRCGKNYTMRRGKCVPKQNCGANAYRNVEGDCHCKKNYEWRGGKCQWKVNKNGFEIAPWKKPGCKGLQSQCNAGNNKACMSYEERCQPN